MSQSIDFGSPLHSMGFGGGVLSSRTQLFVGARGTANLGENGMGEKKEAETKEGSPIKVSVY